MQLMDTVKLVRGLGPEALSAGMGEEVPADGLPAGTLGAIVDVLGDGEAFEVEFVDESGQTVGIATLRSEQIEPA